MEMAKGFRELIDKYTEKGREDGEKEGRKEGALGLAASLVLDGVLSTADAATRAGVDVAELEAAEAKLEA